MGGDKVLRALLVVVLVALAVGAQEVQGPVHHVIGGNRRWNPDSDIGTWLSGRVFRVGDKLWFTYSVPQESIVELQSLDEFQSCDLSNPIKMYTDGVNQIPLESEGNRYFVIGNQENCNNGLKLHVDVKPTEMQPLPDPWSEPFPIFSPPPPEPKPFLPPPPPEHKPFFPPPVPTFPPPSEPKPFVPPPPEPKPFSPPPPPVPKPFVPPPPEPKPFFPPPSPPPPAPKPFFPPPSPPPPAPKPFFPPPSPPPPAPKPFFPPPSPPPPAPKPFFPPPSPPPPAPKPSPPPPSPPPPVPKPSPPPPSPPPPVPKPSPPPPSPPPPVTPPSGSIQLNGLSFGLFVGFLLCFLGLSTGL